jgi:recombination protein RecA
MSLPPRTSLALVDAMQPELDSPTTGTLAELARQGRLVELGGQACTSSAVSILAHAQREGETAAWVQLARGDLYPPDLAEAGIDLDALVVIHVPREGASATKVGGPHGQCRAAELLLRSGAFGLVVLDFLHGEPQGSSAWQGRLLGLARQHDARVLILRDVAAEQPSLGPLIGLRVDTRVEPSVAQDEPPGFVARTGQFRIVHEVVKNKSGGPLLPTPELRRGPWGLR